MGVVKMATAFPLPSSFIFEVLASDFVPHPALFFHRRQFDSRRHSRAFANHSSVFAGIGRLRDSQFSRRRNVGDDLWAPGPLPTLRFESHFVISSLLDFKACGCYNGGTVNGNIDLGRVFQYRWGRLRRGSSPVAPRRRAGRTPSSALLSISRWLQESISSRSHAAAAPLNFSELLLLTRTRPDRRSPSGNSSSFPLPTTLGTSTFFNYLPLFGLGRGTVV